MKKLLPIFLFVLMSSLSWAQQKKTTTERIDAMLESIDKSGVTSGILYDRVMQFANLTNYSQEKGEGKTKFKHFEQSWLDLEKASYDFKGVKFVDLKSKISEDRKKKIVPIGIISTSMNTLNYDKNALEENGLRLKEDKFQLIKGKEAFNLHQVFLASPLESYVHGPEITFELKDSYWLKGIGKQVKNVSLAVEGRTYEIVKNGNIQLSQLTVFFDKTGYKPFEFKATYQDGSTHISKSEIFVKVSTSRTRTNDPLVVDFSGANGYDAPPELAFQGYDENTAYQGHLDYRIYYRTKDNNTSTRLLKPLIVIDGFDPGDKRKFEDADSPRPADEHLSIVEFMSYIDENNQPTSLLNELREEGYDVILVNHPTYTRGNKTIDGGADYIERNGLTHAGFYQFILSSFAARDNRLVIVAPSMGGQISRYALAYMEKNSIQHRVRLWISIDSPHLGANVPLGAQTLLDEAADEGSVGAMNFVSQLNSPAAKQQLIEQFSSSTNNPTQAFLNGKTISQGFNQNRGAPFYVQYYNNLFGNGLPNSKGYPQNLRKIAVANGSLTGSKEYLRIDDNLQEVYDSYVNDGQIALNIRGFNNTLLFDIHVASLESYFMPSFGNNSKIARYKDAGDDDSMYVTNNNSRGSMDNIPGGWFPTQHEIAKSVEEASLPEFLDFWDFRTVERASSHIPTFSALGHLNPDQNWGNPLNKNLVCSDETPFDTYYGEAVNTQHTSFNQSSVNWLMEELAGNFQAPSFPIEENALSGESCMCGNEVSTFSFENCSITETPTWTSSGNLTILSTTENSVTIRAQSDTRTPGWIEANFPDGQKIRKNLWVGKPASPSGSVSGPSNPFYGSIVEYSGGVAQGATSYTWYAPSPYIINPYVVTSPNEWRLLSGYTTRNLRALTGPDNGLIQFMGINKCGNGGAKTRSVTVSTTPGGGDGDIAIPIANNGGNNITAFETFSVYPNPVKDVLFLKIPNVEIGNGIVQIFSTSGRLVYKGEFLPGLNQIPINKISSGIYIVKYHDSKNTITKKILIE